MYVDIFKKNLKKTPKDTMNLKLEGQRYKV
jgi:hypothetical protein